MCARCDELEEEVAYLRSELNAITDAGLTGYLQATYKLRPQEARLLEILHRTRGRMVDQFRLAEMLNSGSESGKLITALVWRIRKTLGPKSIITVWGQGFVLPPETHALVEAAIASNREVAA